jgi:N-acetyl sugar amidotransferase
MKICSKGVWDESIPGIKFDSEGVSNFAKIQEVLMNEYPRGEKGLKDWKAIVEKVQNTNKNKEYNCIVGVSGGVDSSYLMYLLKVKYGLRPLAVNLDNGWNSDIAVKNIKEITNALGIDLETYVIDYEEIKDLLRSYMLSGLPWVDIPTDDAIKSVMYHVARKVGVKYIFRGNDFRSEGKQPKEWTYSDNLQLRSIHKKFGRLKRLKTYPYLPLRKIIINGMIHKIKDIRPFYYLDYNKAEAKEFLKKEYNWEYYGGHHHENLFTKFVMSYWLPRKFNIDKRKINLSAQVMSGAISRDQALDELGQPFETEENLTKLKSYVLSKLDFTDEDFEKIWVSENKTFLDYPSLYKRISFFKNRFGALIKYIYPQKPMSFVELEVNESINDKKS